MRAAVYTTAAGLTLAEGALAGGAALRSAVGGRARADADGGDGTTADTGAAEATFEDATDSATDGAPTTSFEGSTSGDDVAAPPSPSF